jgi:hypothetical protein
MGIGAMCTVMLKLPLTSTLLATLLLYSDGLAVMPLVIVAVVVAYAATAWLPQTLGELSRKPAGRPPAAEGAASTPPGVAGEGTPPGSVVHG